MERTWLSHRRKSREFTRKSQNGPSVAYFWVDVRAESLVAVVVTVIATVVAIIVVVAAAFVRKRLYSNQDA